MDKIPITSLVLLAIWGIIKLLERRNKSKEDKVVNRLLDNSRPSFSLLIIMKKPSPELRLMIQSLIRSSDYTIEGTHQRVLRFVNWNDEIRMETVNLKMGIIEMPNYVLLNDPEGVMIIDRPKMEEFSRDLDCKLVITAWEKVSATVILDVYEGGKLLSATMANEENTECENINPDEHLLNYPDCDTLKSALMKHRINLAELFDSNSIPITEYAINYSETTN